MESLIESLINLSEEEQQNFPFKVGDHCIINDCKLFHPGLVNQKAIVVKIGKLPFDFIKVARIIAEQHTVPGYTSCFEWDIVPELLTHI
jgi:hypothetical protein